MANGRRCSTLELAMRRHTWLRFQEIAIQAAHHLQLSAWEVNFIVSLVETGTETRDEMALSDKQLKVLLRLEDRVKVQQLLDMGRTRPQLLSTWEEEFLSTLTQSRAELSEKQAHVLLRIQDKVTAHAEAGVPINPGQPPASDVQSSASADCR
jgi:hypothetical protein